MSKEGKFILSFLLWFLGSAGIGMLHYVSASDWMSWIIIVLILAWGACCLWFYNHL